MRLVLDMVTPPLANEPVTDEVQMFDTMDVGPQSVEVDGGQLRRRQPAIIISARMRPGRIRMVPDVLEDCPPVAEWPKAEGATEFQLIHRNGVLVPVEIVARQTKLLPGRKPFGDLPAIPAEIQELYTLKVTGENIQFSVKAEPEAVIELPSPEFTPVEDALPNVAHTPDCSLGKHGHPYEGQCDCGYDVQQLPSLVPAIDKVFHPTPEQIRIKELEEQLAEARKRMEEARLQYASGPPPMAFSATYSQAGVPAIFPEFDKEKHVVNLPPLRTLVDRRGNVVGHFREFSEVLPFHGTKQTVADLVRKCGCRVKRDDSENE